jgi:hypothetical protein
MQVYAKRCPVEGCGKDIEGTSETQVQYNLKLHLDKHRRDSEKFAALGVASAEAAEGRQAAGAAHHGPKGDK